VIQDNDTAGVISFSVAAYTINETGSVATITVNRSGGAAGGVTVDYTVTDGTATNGIDYTAESGTVTFGSNDLVKTFQILITNDDELEGNETVLLSLSNPTGRASLGALTNAVLTIKDDEIDARGTFNLSGNFTQRECYNTDENGSASANGQVFIVDQTGHDFSGRAVFVFPTAEALFNGEIHGTIDSAGKVSGTYEWYGVYGEPGAGTFTGTLSGNNLQMTFNGYGNSAYCLHTGTMSGSRYLPVPDGYAPAFPQGGRVDANINVGSGYLDYTGRFSLQLSPSDNT